MSVSENPLSSSLAAIANFLGDISLDFNPRLSKKLLAALMLLSKLEVMPMAAILYALFASLVMLQKLIVLPVSLTLKVGLI